MVEFGYFLSSEDNSPDALVHQARLASDAGIESVWISDHFHPWLDDQGESPFVWSVIGAISAVTDLHVATAVTCPTMRMHPVITAQAAATSSLLLDGKFTLGVGTGENLNEHVLGDTWPATDLRLEMLEEAVDVMRQLWSGETTTFRGKHYTAEAARIYSCPSAPPEVHVSGFGPNATDLAAKIADGYVSTSPDKELVDRYRAGGGKGPASAGFKFCWGADADDCAKTAHHLWRTSGVPGELSQELRTPAHFDQAAELVTVESVAENMPCGPDAEPIVELARKYVEAGFDRLYFSQIGDNQDEFFEFYARELGPMLADL